MDPGAAMREIERRVAAAEFSVALTLLEAAPPEPDHAALWRAMKAYCLSATGFPGSVPDLACGALDAALPPNVRYYAAAALRNIGADALAIDALSSLVREFPQFGEAHRLLGQLLLRNRVFDRGQAHHFRRFFIAGTQFSRAILDIPYFNATRPEARSVLIWPEQGIGEQILFSWVVRRLVERGVRCLVCCDGRLIETFRANYAGADFIDTADDAAVQRALGLVQTQGSFEAIAEQLVRFEGLSEQTRTRLEPSASASCHVQEQVSLLGVSRYALVSWSSPLSEYSGQKSIPLHLLPDLVRRIAATGVRVVSFQYSDEEDGLRRCRDAGVELLHLPIDYRNHLDLGLVVAARAEFAVTCSNAHAHLAASAGTQTLILLPLARGRMWYWFTGDGPVEWYAQAHRYSADADGSWEAAVQRVGEVLHPVAGAHPAITPSSSAEARP